MLCRRAFFSLLILWMLAAQLWAQAGRRNPKPGFNLFSTEQDIQIGREAKAEIEKQYQVVQNPVITGFIRSIGQKITAQPEAGKYPYTFDVVNDKNINAFALPGGPTFVNSGLIAAADNEAQIAGVMAHEVAHVALRHGTNQASKANLIQLPAMLAGALAGRSMLGQLAQLGIGLGANSVLLKYSRDAESDADLLGTRIMAGAGYDPVELARFFQKLEAGGGGGRQLQFFSDHPNPGNRMKAIQDELRYLPKAKFVTDTGRLARVKAEVAKLPDPPKKAAVAPAQAQAGGAAPPQIRPSGSTRQYQGRGLTLAYPDNWEVFADRQGPGFTIAPRDGLVKTADGGVAVGFGVIVNVYTPPGGQVDLQRDTDALVRQLAQSNSGMSVLRGARPTTVDSRRAMAVTLSSASPFQGQETDLLVAVDRASEVLYIVFVAPAGEFQRLDPTFGQILRSVRLSN